MRRIVGIDFVVAAVCSDLTVKLGGWCIRQMKGKERNGSCGARICFTKDGFEMYDDFG